MRFLFFFAGACVGRAARLATQWKPGGYYCWGSGSGKGGGLGSAGFGC
jgi:hypothetical protein